MNDPKLSSVIRECAGNIRRELRITLSRTPRPDKWVFIAGCYNSGTTLLREILGSHPLISALPAEGQYLTDQFPSDHEIGLPRMWVKREDLYRLKEGDTGPDATRIKKEWGLQFDKSKPIFLEHTPANAARTRWLEKNFENAYFIGVVRNGYAVTEGIMRKAKPIHSKNGWSTEEAAYQWSHSNKVLKEDSRHLKHFIWCKYEDLAENPNKEIRKILEFLGIANQCEMDLNKKWSIHERNQGIRNMNVESINRLSREQIFKINGVLGEMLPEFFYDVISDN